MKKLLLALLLASTSAFAGINQSCPELTVNGVPQYRAGGTTVVGGNVTQQGQSKMCVFHDSTWYCN